MGSDKPVARKDDIVIQKLETETLVYDLEENKAFCLNETSAHVWELCDGRNTVADIADKMSGRMETQVTDDLILIALDQFRRDGLLGTAGKDYLGELSRREVIRKAGYFSAIALPMVSSLVAPDAAMAQSCLAIGLTSVCTSNGDCCSNNCFPVSGATPPDRCCAAGVTGAPALGGAAIPPATVGYCLPNDSDCAPVGAQWCCSGSGFAIGGVGGCGATSGLRECRCN